jgi:hypothetical protein
MQKLSVFSPLENHDKIEHISKVLSRLFEPGHHHLGKAKNFLTIFCVKKRAVGICDGKIVTQ